MHSRLVTGLMRAASTISAVTIPVGTAMIASPRIVTIAASVWPGTDWGVMSPYPTVVMLTITQYTLRGMLVNPASSPSNNYIAEPRMVTRTKTVPMKTITLLRLARIALASARRSDQAQSAGGANPMLAQAKQLT